MAMEKAPGENQQSNHEACGQGGWACQGALGTGHSCREDPWDHCLWHRDEERWGERLKCVSLPKCTFLQRLVQPDVSHLSRLARFSGLGCKNSIS